MIRPFRSEYGVCPNGHGKLVKLDKFQRSEWRSPSEAEEKRKAWTKTLPQAVKVGLIKSGVQVAIYTIQDMDGFFMCDIDSRPDKSTECPAGDVIAKISCGKSCLARIFRRANLTEKQRSRFEKRVKEA